MLEDEDIRTAFAAGELDPTQVCNRLVNVALIVAAKTMSRW